MDPDVLLGVWTNWSSGRVLGLTLTIPKSHGVVLIAALALIVKWAGSRFWGIICFIAHYRRTNHKPHDALHYQHQALLRSKPSESDFLWRLYETSWAWRSYTPKVYRRSIPLGFLALTNLAAFVIAGIFSAKVTVTDGPALATGLCGKLPAEPNKPLREWTKDDMDIGDVKYAVAYNGHREIAQQVRLCYAVPFFNGLNARCGITEVQRIDSMIDRNATCPFAEDVCTSPAIKLDSGLINANSHLGINVGPEDNVQVRKVTTCAPLNMDSFSTNWTQEFWPNAEQLLWFIFPNDTYKYYSLGRTLNLGQPSHNFTFVASNYSSISFGLWYELWWRTAIAKNLNDSGFDPIASLKRTDADISVLSLINRVAYTGPVDDPFFKAMNPSNPYSKLFIAAPALTGIACTEQYQIGGSYNLDVVNTPKSLRLNPRQQGIYRILRAHLEGGTITSMVSTLSNEILAASRLIWGSNGISMPLPSTQWQTEVENFHNMTLAGLQMQQIYFAATPNTQIRPGLTLHDHIIPRTDPNEQYICRNQRVRSPRFSSFNMFGIFVIVTVSLIVIVLDIFTPAIARWLSNTSFKGQISGQAWEEDDILHIQRSALESQGIGPWKDTKGSIPVTAGWDQRFRRGKTYKISKYNDRSFEGFERLTTATTECEDDTELTKVPVASVMRL